MPSRKEVNPFSCFLEVNMPNYATADIRNVVFLGHAGAGKTTLLEAILHKNGLTSRLGSVDDKTSILDIDEEERERGHSVDSALCHLNYKGKEINCIDTPGYPDFFGAAMTGLAGAETAVIVVGGTAGVQINTRKLFEAAKGRGMAIAFVINKMDSSPADLASVVNDIQESFGMECRCANLPTSDGSGIVDILAQEAGDAAFGDVAEAHTNLVETIIESDESLMENYLGGEAVAPEKLYNACRKAMAGQGLFPIFFTSARQEKGVDELCSFIANMCPSPVDGLKLQVRSGEGENVSLTPIAATTEGKPLGLVIRISYDARSHIKYSTIRMQRGVLKSDSTIEAAGEKRSMRAGNIAKLQGDKLENIDEAIAGDLVTLAKLEETKIFETIYASDLPGIIETPPVPTPMYSLAIEPKSRGDEAKISSSLAEMADADPTLKIDRDPQTHEVIVSAMGELHIRVNLSRMHRRRSIDVNSKAPEIPYRETIVGSTQHVEYTHKKQSGGAGQFARVFIDMEPNERGAGYEFLDKIFGGSIDQSFRPSVDKGCQAAMKEGVIAGFPVVDVKVSLVDGKTHPVDSKDIAFQVAGREAFRKAFNQSSPILLEPIVHLEVTVPAKTSATSPATCPVGAAEFRVRKSCRAGSP
jgi:elongation factor G